MLDSFAWISRRFFVEVCQRPAPPLDCCSWFSWLYYSVLSTSSCFDWWWFSAACSVTLPDAFSILVPVPLDQGIAGTFRRNWVMKSQIAPRDSVTLPFPQLFVIVAHEYSMIWIRQSCRPISRRLKDRSKDHQSRSWRKVDSRYHFPQSPTISSVFELFFAS